LYAVLLIEEENKRNNLSLLGTVETDAWPMNDFTPFLTNDPDGAPPLSHCVSGDDDDDEDDSRAPVPRKTHKNAPGRHPFPPPTVERRCRSQKETKEKK